jgi:predicted enzyme related to lactoylglutathione lyase
MQRVRGIGGVFFKSRNPPALAAWYRDRLGLPIEPFNGAIFTWREHDARGDAYSVWSLFPADTDHFKPSDSAFMINFRVDDLAAMLAQLRAAGETTGPDGEDTEYGRFSWVMDPEGNRVELWQPSGPAT